MKKRNRNTPKRMRRARWKGSINAVIWSNGDGRTFAGKAVPGPIEISQDLAAFIKLIDGLDGGETQTQF